MAEKTNGNMTLYVYGADGSVIGMMYHEASYSENQWDVFWFEKNMQGDIVAVYSEAGTKLVSYTYDAWGNFRSTYHNGGSSSSPIGNNPFLYRGYYYDRDLKLYYLNARYYDPVVGRFISADDTAMLGANGDFTSLNLYSYCGNNPILRTDDSGHLWINVLIGAAVGAVAGVVGQVISDTLTSLFNGEISISNWQTCTGAAIGGAAGGIVLATTGNIDAANAITGAITTGVGQSLEKLTINDYNKSWAEIGANMAFDGAVGYALGKLPGIGKITSGRNNWSAVYRSGLTKLRNSTATKMSTKVVAKGLGSSIVGGFALDGYYGVKQHAYDRIKNFIPKVLEG